MFKENPLDLTLIRCGEIVEGEEYGNIMVIYLHCLLNGCLKKESFLNNV